MIHTVLYCHLHRSFFWHMFCTEMKGADIAMNPLISGFCERQKTALSLWDVLENTLVLIFDFAAVLAFTWEGDRTFIVKQQSYVHKTIWTI